MNIDVSIADDDTVLLDSQYITILWCLKNPRCCCCAVPGGGFGTKLLLNGEQSEGNIRTSITEAQHVFGGSLHTPDFVSASPKESFKKSDRFCNYLSVGGEEEEKI